MKNLEQHITSVELSKQLRDAGIEIENEFWWFPCITKNERISSKRYYLVNEKDADYEYDMLLKHRKSIEDNPYQLIYPAPLATELLEILPKVFGEKYLTISSTYISKQWLSFVDYYDFHTKQSIASFSEEYQCLDLLPNALAKMLIYLKKHEII